MLEPAVNVADDFFGLDLAAGSSSQIRDGGLGYHQALKLQHRTVDLR